MRGPTRRPAAISLRHACTMSSSLPMSRTPVTPLAMKSGSEISRASGNQSPNTRCTCMSQSPGMRKRPRLFTIGALRGCFADLLGSTEAMRLPSRTTVCSACKAPVRTSTTVTLLSTNWSLAVGFCAWLAAPKHRQNRRTTPKCGLMRS